MAKGPEPLFELEATIMQVVWRQFPVSARDVLRALEHEKERAYTTIMTTMDRLHKKGHLRRSKEGLAWVYAPMMSEAEYRRRLADGLADQLLVEHGEVGVLAIVEAASADDGLLSRLEELIASKRRGGRR
jgi:predicted transcriptional regulator